MGLFSNKDKPCPICGGATPRLLAKKFEGEAICGKCADNIMADNVMVKSWTLDDLKEHLRYREQNRNLLKNFTPTRKVDYEHEMVIDDDKRLFYINRWTVDNPPVFRFEEIAGFRMELGYQTVESWSRGMQRIPYLPPALGLASGLSMLAEAFNGGKDEKKESKFENLKVTLLINSRYLKEYELCDLSISGSGTAEFEHDFARELSKANVVCGLVVSIASGSMAGVAGASSPTTPATPTAEQTADSIKKFKELLDDGIITQEEFDVKKKQLLEL